MPTSLSPSNLLPPQHRAKAAMSPPSNLISPQHRAKATMSPPSKLLSPQHRVKASAQTSDENLSCYDDFSSLFIQSFLSHEKQTHDDAHKRDLSKFIELPGHSVHPHAQKHLKRSNTTKPLQKNNERRHIKEMRKTLLGSTKQRSKQQPGRKSKLGPLPYVEANTKISRVLKHMKLKTTKDDMQASRLNDFYKLVARETEAAIVLQSSCRRVLATARVKQLALESAQATKIQCFVRQFIARSILKELQCAKRKAMLIRERFVRVYVARCRRRKQIKLEKNAAIICQSAVRMYFAKRLLLSMQLQHSWEVNQIRWKKLSIRLSFANMRINFYARQIQCIVRRRLARKRVASIYTKHSKAALRIQCCWRRFDAQLRKLDLLYERSVEQHCNKLRIITSEHNYWTEKVAELNSPAKLQSKANVELERANLMEERKQKYEEINSLESHFEDQYKLLQEISAQDVESGWEDQIKLNLADTRERITNAKLDLLFRIQVKLKSAEQKLDVALLKEKEAKDSADHWGNWRQSEQDALWTFIRRHDDKVAEKVKRRSIIDEQMRWEVKFYNANGKPDKRRKGFSVDSVNHRINELAASAALQLDKLQEMRHISRTWLPFQRIVDQFNNGSLFHLLNDNTHLHAKNEKVQFAPRGKANHGDHHTTGDRLNPFPQHLPWNLIKEARDERKQIESVTNNVY